MVAPRCSYDVSQFSTEPLFIYCIAYLSHKQHVSGVIRGTDLHVRKRWISIENRPDLLALIFPYPPVQSHLRVNHTTKPTYAAGKDNS